MLPPEVQALLLTTLAGLATVLGAGLGLLNKKPGPRYTAFMMAASAGVMIFVSFTELYVEAQHVLGGGLTLLFFVAGIVVILVIDQLIPERENVHGLLDSELPASITPDGTDRLVTRQDGGGAESVSCVAGNRDKIMKMGLLTALAMMIHNFPEGLATFSAALVDPSLGYQIAIAIALHNIPEGICVAVPVYMATCSKRKAMLYASISGLAEPAGALVAWLVIGPYLNEMVLMMLLALVAGIMVYISVDTLIPTAKTIEGKHGSIFGFLTGTIIMGISLLLL